MRVLITGTTSGLGKALAEHYEGLGHEVIAVNRADVDITDYPKVRALLQGLAERQQAPDVLILSAGINRPDNCEQFDYPTFDLVMRTNLDGVMTFVGACASLGWKKKKLVAISSTSNIVPNPGHVAYYLSKLALKEAFTLLQRNDPFNRYQAVILGPVNTNIAAGYPKATGLSGKIFDFLAVPPKSAARQISAFLEGEQMFFNYPKSAQIFYLVARGVLLFFPWLYAGTRRSSIASAPSA